MDFTSGDADPTPAIVAAAMRGDYRELEQLLNQRPGVVNDCDEDDSTALICSAVGGYADIVQLLLERAADPNKQDKIGGYTALMLAAKFNYIDVVRTLVERGADVTIKDFEGNIAIRYAKSEEMKKILARPDETRRAWKRQLAAASLEESKKQAILEYGNAENNGFTAAKVSVPKKTKSIFAK